MEDEWDYNNKLTALAQREQAVRTDLSDAIYRYRDVAAAAVAARADVAAQEERVQAEVESIRRERLVSIPLRPESRDKFGVWCSATPAQMYHCRLAGTWLISCDLDH